MGAVDDYEYLPSKDNQKTRQISQSYRHTRDGNAVGGILRSNDPIDKFYAYGIPDNFGMTSVGNGIQRTIVDGKKYDA